MGLCQSLLLSVCLSVSQLVHPLVPSLVLPPDGCIVVCLSDLFNMKSMIFETGEFAGKMLDDQADFPFGLQLHSRHCRKRMLLSGG